MKRKTLKDMYLQYPYKNRDITSNTVPQPYFPKDQIVCDHKYSLTYKEWKNILGIFFKHVMNALAQGFEYKFPYEQGRIGLRKVKGGGVDFQKTTKGNVKKFKNLHLRGWRFLIKWYRYKNKLQYKWVWRIRLTKHAWSYINEIFKNSPREINNLSDA